MSKIIVIGGGLSGASAANTILEHGGRVLLLDKNAFCGGNSVKATSGINGAGTSTQFLAKISDNAEEFYKDIWYSAAGLDKSDAKPYELAKTLAYESGPAVTWLQNKFHLDLSKVSRLGGHSFPRTHRGKEKFPGMTITMTLLEALEEAEKQDSTRCQIVNEALVTRLIMENDTVVGVEYTKAGKKMMEYGSVIIASGGYAADYTETSLLKQYRPDLMSYPTTNGEHCTGDGIKMAIEIGADVVDMEWVQVHPTGLVHPDDSTAKVKWLAAEALRGVGGIMIDRHGKRFVNELGTRDYVSTEMLQRHDAQGPYRLVINSKGSKEIEWHCHHYVSRKLMKHYSSGKELALDMNISEKVLQKTMDVYSKQGLDGKDTYGKKYFDNLPFSFDDSFYVAIVCPVVHYSMGGLRTNSKAEVLDKKGNPIQGLWVTGEACGGIHGKNRMGGNSLLDCVVWGRLSGSSACAYQLKQSGKEISDKRIQTLLRHLNIKVDEQTKQITMAIPLTTESNKTMPTINHTPKKVKIIEQKEFTVEQVSQHATESDCWIIVNGQVINTTSFLNKHPGGKQVLLLWAGKDATTEFNMFHKKDAIQKYAPELIIGTVVQPKL